MSIKSFFVKKALQLKGMSKEQAEAMSEAVEKNPALMEAFKKMNEDPKLMALLKKIQEETELKIKNGMDSTMATMGTLSKYKNELAQYRDLLEPISMLLQK
jgi:hypothetical protein